MKQTVTKDKQLDTIEEQTGRITRNTMRWRYNRKAERKI